MSTVRVLGYQVVDAFALPELKVSGNRVTGQHPFSTVDAKQLELLMPRPQKSDSKDQARFILKHVKSVSVLCKNGTRETWDCEKNPDQAFKAHVALSRAEQYAEHAYDSAVPNAKFNAAQSSSRRALVYTLETEAKSIQTVTCRTLNYADLTKQNLEKELALYCGVRSIDSIVVAEQAFPDNTFVSAVTGIGTGGQNKFRVVCVDVTKGMQKDAATTIYLDQLSKQLTEIIDTLYPYRDYQNFTVPQITALITRAENGSIRVLRTEGNNFARGATVEQITAATFKSMRTVTADSQSGVEMQAASKFTLPALKFSTSSVTHFGQRDAAAGAAKAAAAKTSGASAPQRAGQEEAQDHDLDLGDIDLYGTGTRTVTMTRPGSGSNGNCSVM